jgi:nitrite reductase/ring-hydroxylating ferredoxin subunit
MRASERHTIPGVIAMGEDRDVETPAGCLRRRVLLTSLTGAVAAGLAGCTSATSSVPEAGTGAPTGVAAQFLARTDEVPVGGGVTVGNILVVQPTAGTFRAFSIVCPHRGARVSPPDDSGIMTCWEHTSTFRAEDGARIAGPATRGLTQVPLTVKGTDILTA